MRTDRLLLVADKLRTVPEAQFDMETWTEHPSAPRFDCGTVGCVAGWAGAIPELVRDGYFIEWMALSDIEGEIYWHGEPGFKGLSFEQALRAFFELSMEDVDTIFYEGERMTAKEKAAQIEQLCRDYEENRARGNE